MVKKQLDQLDHSVIYLMDCADVSHMNNSHINIQSELGFLSTKQLKDYSNYQNMISSLRVLGLSKFRLKVVGTQHIPIPEFLGIIDISRFISFYNGVDICLDFDAKNLLDIAVSNSFCLSNIPNNLYPHYDNSKHMMEKIEHYLREPEERKEVAKHAFDKIMKSDTSLHRLIDVFTGLNRPDLVDKTQRKLEEIKNENRNND